MKITVETYEIFKDGFYVTPLDRRMKPNTVKKLKIHTVPKLVAESLQAMEDERSGAKKAPPNIKRLILGLADIMVLSKRLGSLWYYGSRDRTAPLFKDRLALVQWLRLRVLC